MTIDKLVEMCGYLQDCADQLEEDIKIGINDCSNKLHGKGMSDVKMALEKAKDFHYKEIIQILGEIATNVKKVYFHVEKIKQLNNKENMTEEEIKKYSYVKRQIEVFSNDKPMTKVVTRRELRRAASEVSVSSLATWNQFLDSRELKEKVMESASSLPDINEAFKRKTQTRRKHKKLISSTFNGILDDNDFVGGSLDLLTEETLEDSIDGKHESDIDNLKKSSDSESDNIELIEEDSNKPKIVGVIYKK